VAVASYRGLFRNRNFVRVFSAGLGSVAGSSIAGVCLVWIVAIDTGSALDVALLAAANLIATLLFSTVGGTLVDRYDRRRLMILSDVVRAVTLGLVVVDLQHFGLNLPLLFAANGIIGAFTVVFNPAEQAIVPALVPAGQVADANGLVRSSRSSLQFVGVAVGGILIVTLGAVWGVGVNALTFALSAALLTGMQVRSHLPPTGSSPTPRPGYWSEMRAGFAWLWQAQGFFQLTMSAMFFNFSSTLIGTFLVFYATLVLHGSAAIFATLLAAEVAGTAVGSLLVGRVGAVRYAGKAWVVPYGVVSGAVALVLPLVVYAPVDIAALFALGVLGGFAGTAWLTAAQLLVPTEMQGRYYGIDSLGSVAILPVAQIGGALLIDAVATRETYLIAAILWVVSGTVFLFARAMWQLGVLPSEPTSPAAAGGAGTIGSPEGTRRE
jgi:Na+/melibiose symporter-like transporter